jgi:hypothetical protein
MIANDVGEFDSNWKFRTQLEISTKKGSEKSRGAGPGPAAASLQPFVAGSRPEPAPWPGYGPDYNLHV